MLERMKEANTDRGNGGVQTLSKNDGDAMKHPDLNTVMFDVQINAEQVQLLRSDVSKKAEMRTMYLSLISTYYGNVGHMIIHIF